MIGKIISANNNLIPELPPEINNPAEPLEPALNVLVNVKHEADKKSLCDRIITRLRNLLDKIFFCFKKNVEKAEKAPVVNEEQEIPEEEEDIIENIEWYENREPQGFINANDVPGEYFSARYLLEHCPGQELLHDHVQLIKETIREIPNPYIDLRQTRNIRRVEYRDETFLLLAIHEIVEPAERLEVVRLLLEKGANPRKTGKILSSVSLLELAGKTEHQPLIDLLEQTKRDFAARRPVVVQPGNPVYDAYVLRREERRQRELRNDPESLRAREESQKAFSDAFSLLFHSKNAPPLTHKQQQDRLEKLKDIIPKISEDHINSKKRYKENELIYNVGLLYLVLVNYKDKDICHEIVQMLVEQGICPNPESEEFGSNGINELLSPIEEARKANDQQLIDLLSNA